MGGLDGEIDLAHPAGYRDHTYLLSGTLRWDGDSTLETLQHTSWCVPAGGHRKLAAPLPSWRAALDQVKISYVSMECGSFDDVPLHALFPQSTAVDVELMRSAARAVDPRRPSSHRPLWEWALQHAVFPGTQVPGTSVILLATITISAQDADWLEFELDISWTREGLLCASAAVGVACWCDLDHGTHYIHPLALVVGDGLSLGQLWWRTRASLPSP